MLLSDVSLSGRDNNFNLIRLVAALAVLVAHSWPLALGLHVPDPLAAWTGIGLGGIAVDVFFVTSGFLVTASLMRRGNLLDFAVARALRIYPALLVVVVACIGLGLIFTARPWAEFLQDSTTVTYLWKNAIAIRGAEYYLPGAFASNPVPLAMNGSLWTLLWELKMYLTLGVIWWLAGYVKDRPRAEAAQVAIVALAVATTALYFFNQVAPGILPKGLIVKNTLVPGFLLGAACYVLRARIRLELGWFLAAMLLVLATGAWGSRAALHAVYFLTLPYAVFFLAYVPKGAVRHFNRLGDYSYGVYIFAWPVQQTIIALLPGVGVLGVMAGATAGSLALAWWSWRLVEEPALLKRPAAAATLRTLTEKLSRNEKNSALDRVPASRAEM